MRLSEGCIFFENKPYFYTKCKLILFKEHFILLLTQQKQKFYETIDYENNLFTEKRTRRLVMDLKRLDCGGALKITVFFRFFFLNIVLSLYPLSVHTV